MPNPPELVETPLGGGLMQKTAEAHVPFGELTIARNVRQTKNGLLGKRPGNTKLTNQAQQPNGIGAVTLDVTKGGALSAFGNQLLLTTNAGICAYSSTYGTFGVLQPASEALATRRAVTIPQILQASQNSVALKMAPAACTDGTHYFYCWVTSGGACFVTVEDIATGAIVQYQTQPFPGASNVVWAVPILVGTQFTVVGLDSSGNIKMGGWASPYTSILPTVSATLVAASATTTCMIDAAAIDASHFVVGWANAGTTIHLDEFTAAGVVAGNASVISTASPIDIRLSLSSGTIWLGVNSSAPTLKITAYNATTLAILMTNFSVLTSSVYSFGVLGLSGTQCAVAFTYSDSSVQTTQCDVIDRTLSAGAGGFTLQAANKTTSCAIASRPFTQGSKTYLWLQVYSDSGSSQSASLYAVQNNNQTQWTFILADTLIDSAQSSFPHPMRPVTVDAPRFSFPVGHRNVTLANGSFAPLSIVSPSSDQWAIVGAVRANSYVSTWNRFVVDFNSARRWKTITLGTLLLQSAGMVTCWDGQRCFENGFLDHVCLPTVTSVAGGSLDASKDFYYRVVPMQPDGAGNLHRGIPSSLLKGTTTGTNLTLQIKIPTISLTDRSPYASSSTAVHYPAFYEIYRSQPSPTSSGTDIATNYLDVISATGEGTVTYTDLGAIGDLPLASNALCYTFGGALPNGCPPGALDIVAHQGRAWIIADDGTTLYFSKQIVDGEAVNFTDSFTMPLDDQALALASMDDKLIVFTAKKIYYLVGLGPADNGSQNDYAGFIRIQSTVGCIDRRSVVATSDGVYFQSPIGIYLLSRGLDVVYVGQPIADELATYPVIVSANLHPTQPWVYFYATNAAGNAGERLVYDYRVQKWYVDSLPGVPVSATSTANGTHYWLDTTGQVWQEASTAPGSSCLDDGAYVVSDVETTLHAVGIDGWQNLARVQLLFYRNSPHDLTIQTRPMYGSTYDTPPKFFNDVALSAMTGYLGRAGQVGQVEIVPQSSKVNAIAIRITDAAPTGGAALGTGQGPSLFALAAITQPEPATLALVSDAQRGTPP